MRAENRKNTGKIGLGLLTGFVLFSILSCSTVGGLFHWTGLISPKDAKMNRLFSDMRVHPGNPDSHYLLACYLQERGRHKEALEAFGKVLLFDPYYVKAYNGMGVSYDLLGEYQKAVESYKTALLLNGDLGYVQNNLGYSYLLQGNIDEAIGHIEKAVALNGAESRFHNNLGLAYGEKGQFDLALKEFKKAGDEATAHYNMAQVYLRKGLFEGAGNHYAMALNINPSLTAVRTSLDAATLLARILLPVDLKKEKEELIVPGQPVVASETETINNEGAQRVATVPTIEEVATITPSAAPEIETMKMPESAKVVRTAREADALKISKAESTLSTPVNNKNPDRPKKERVSLLRDTGIEISNGNGVSRMAKQVGDFLKKRGLKVTRLTNADHFKHAETTILFENGYREAAEHVAGQLPSFKEIEEIRGTGKANVKIKVLIGKDLVPQNRYFAANTATQKN